jgi:hypothetical protein
LRSSSGADRWDSLRLFTPAFHSGLLGLPFPAPGSSFPTKDETADYLEAYAARFGLPVRLGQRVDALSRRDDGYPIHHRGVVGAATGRYFLGLPFPHSPTLTDVGGVGKDTRHVAGHLAALAGGPRRRATHAASSASQEAPA